MAAEMTKGIAKDIKNNGKDAIIRRELYARECFWDGGIDRCILALEGYGFTVSEIQSVYQFIRETEIDK